jgi:hypothetical protein
MNYKLCLVLSINYLRIGGGGGYGGLDLLEHELLTAKDLMILHDPSNNKYFDNGRLVQEAALLVSPTAGGAGSGHHNRYNKDRDALLRLTDQSSKEYKDLSMKLILEHILEKTCSRTEEDLLER